jgi:hypothetical protein
MGAVVSPAHGMESDAAVPVHALPPPRFLPSGNGRRLSLAIRAAVRWMSIVGASHLLLVLGPDAEDPGRTGARSRAREPAGGPVPSTLLLRLLVASCSGWLAAALHVPEGHCQIG